MNQKSRSPQGQQRRQHGDDSDSRTRQQQQHDPGRNPGGEDPAVQEPVPAEQDKSRRGIRPPSVDIDKG